MKPKTAPARRPREGIKRGLVLAGGGIKVVYQAGALEVLLRVLSEGGKPAFHHVQAASGGAFNAALMCQYQDGGRVADAWRRFRPLRALSINWSQLPRFLVFKGESILTYRRFKKHFLLARSPRGWGIDFAAIAARDDTCQFHFNAYNFSRHRLESVRHQDLNENKFWACVALPRWFPPARIDPDVRFVRGRKVERDVWVDAVFATDSNADALADLGLDEIWVIWTVDVSGQWRDGWMPNYFRMLEQSASFAYRRERQRLLDAGFVTAEMARGRTGRDRPPILYEIAGDVRLPYLLALSRRKLQRAIDHGARDAEAYLEEHVDLWAEP